MESQLQARRINARVSGRVQGVGFRYFVQSRAHMLDLTGWVRNEYDGSVSVTAEGPNHKLARLLQELRSGPPTARVDDVSVRWEEATGEFESFSVRH